MAKKYKLEHNLNECIGCGACTAVCPDHWEMGEDNKAHIIKGKKRKDGWEEKEIDEKDLKINKEAADSCPVDTIHIKEK